ncbi:MAG TPA: alpha/beta fold hydrolase [Mariprofundaceae bacterium]|nr:alpha/beta fold hydrolase [Mariprofundaceae bacterium]
MRRLRPILLILLALSAGLLQSGCAVFAPTASKEVTTGLWKDWEDMDRLLQPDYPDAPPIILMHGWNGSEFTWPAPADLRKLEDTLHRDIYFFNYRTGLFANRYPPLEIMEEELDRFMSQYKTVDVVAHSMGGLLLRQYLSHHPDHPVRRVVFLSTPHFGTNAAKVLTSVASISAEGNIQAEEIQPGSDFLWQLNEQQGAELDGVQALNVYVGESGWLDGDLVVDPSSAWLPWAHNVKVQGDHHTLAHRLPSFQFIIDFLKDGTLPSVEAEMPARRDVWLRFAPKEDGEPMAIPDTAVHHLNAKGYTTKGGYSICCDARAGLYPAGGNTLVIEDMQPGEAYEFVPRNGHSPVRVPVDTFLEANRPVQLRTIIVPPPVPEAPATQPPSTTSQPAAAPVAPGATPAPVATPPVPAPTPPAQPAGNP